jgi:hypothetical protein
MALTKSAGRFPACTRPRYSTRVSRPRCRRACAGTPLTSRNAGAIARGATTAAVSARSRSVRCNTASARRSTRRVPRRSTSFATGFSVGSTIPCVCTTTGLPQPSASSANGSVTRSRIRWTWTTSADRAYALARASSAGEAIPLTSKRGATCRAGKSRTGTPSTARGNGLPNPSPNAATTARCPRSRSPRQRLSATRVGPPNACVGVCSVTTCSTFTRPP